MLGVPVMLDFTSGRPAYEFNINKVDNSVSNCSKYRVKQEIDYRSRLA